MKIGFMLPGAVDLKPTNLFAAHICLNTSCTFLLIRSNLIIMSQVPKSDIFVLDAILMLYIPIFMLRQCFDVVNYYLCRFLEHEE